MVTDARGAALIDVVAATGLAMVIMTMAVPVVSGSLERERAIVGARYVAGELQRARFAALRRAQSVAVRFETSGNRTVMRLFADGNGNGVLQADVDRGVDIALTPSHVLDEHAQGLSLRINQTITDAAGSATLLAGDDALRVGNTSFVTFSPLGTSTSGSLYVAASHGPQLAVRVFGATGRIRVLMFDALTRRWQP